MLQSVHKERANTPSGELKLAEPFGSSKRVTVILFCVRVPVLSEHMTFALPSVSTAGILRTIARLAAIFFMPSARTIVTTAGKPSGIAATARLIEIINILSGGICCNKPSTKIIIQIAIAPMPSILPVFARLF